MIPDRHGTSRLSSATVYRLLILAGLLVGFLLRLYRLGAESLWYDETVSAFLARQSLVDMLAHTALDIHPPAYYALLHGWVRLVAPFGRPSMEFLLAFPSAWFGALCIVLLIPIGRSMLGREPACLAVWLAAFNPFLLWYGQEVRMYTVAGALGLLCLLSAIRFITLGHIETTDTDLPTVRFGWLLAYIVAASLGIYSLYYFAFAILAINIAVFVSLLLLSRSGIAVRKLSWIWFSAQILILLIFAAWLPLFVRQVVDPPVPPWRTEWSGALAFFSDAASTLAAYVVGHTVPPLHYWVWAGVVLLLIVAYYGYAKSIVLERLPLFRKMGLAQWLPLYVLVPPLSIFAISIVATPIFHVRYLAIFAPAFSLVAAAGLIYLFRQRRALFGLLTAFIVMGTLFSLSRYWRHPEYRPDDHRAAVTFLAEQWRPGDAILSNAGWVYTAIDTYWPSRLSLAEEALPPYPVSWMRLSEVEALSELDSRELTPHGAPTPVVILTGSVDGKPSLGWSSDDADFYAISRDDTIAALDALDDRTSRIWHYRLYDTVNDPDGVIRAWLNSTQNPESDTAFGGNGFLRLEEYTNADGLARVPVPESMAIEFEGGVSMDHYRLPETASAGEYLYLPVSWELADHSVPGDALAASLRLVDSGGTSWAQHDETLPHLIDGATNGKALEQVLALPIPLSTPLGVYDVQLILYHVADLQPLNAVTAEEAAPAVSLGPVKVELPETSPTINGKLTRFDYLDLVKVKMSDAPILPDQSLNIGLLWYPAPSDYVDAYGSRISLVDEDGEIAASWEKALGPPFYPSSQWATGYPVRDQYNLTIPDNLEVGEYHVFLEIYRTSDGLRIPSQASGWWPISRNEFELGAATVAR